MIKYTQKYALKWLKRQNHLKNIPFKTSILQSKWCYTTSRVKNDLKVQSFRQFSNKNVEKLKKVMVL